MVISIETYPSRADTTLMDAGDTQNMIEKYSFGQMAASNFKETADIRILYRLL